MLFAGIFGQISVAADNLDLVIYGLLAIAFLLAALTFWYWRHTKPRPMVVATAAGESPAHPSPALAEDDQSVLDRAMTEEFDPDSVWADAPTSPPTAAVETVPVAASPAAEDTRAPVATEPMSADEWLAITGPDTAPGDATN